MFCVRKGFGNGKFLTKKDFIEETFCVKKFHSDIVCFRDGERIASRDVFQPFVLPTTHKFIPYSKMADRNDDDDDADDDFFDDRENLPPPINGIAQPSVPAPLPPSAFNRMSMQYNELSSAVTQMALTLANLFTEVNTLRNQVASLSATVTARTGTPRPQPAMRRMASQGGGGAGFRSGGGGGASSSSSSSAASAANAINLADAPGEGGEAYDDDDDDDETVAYSQTSCGSQDLSPRRKRRRNISWNADEIDALHQGVAMFGAGNWKDIQIWDAGDTGTGLLRNRTGGQLKDKWREYE
jgi:hypothetical protein